MNPIKLDAIKPDQTFKGELLLDKSFLLLGSGQKITTELIKNLMTWNITELYIDASATPAPSIAQFTEDTDTDEFITLEKKENEAPKMNTSIKEALAKAQNSSNEKSRLTGVMNVYNEYMSYIHSVYTRFATHGDFNSEDLFETVKELCVFVKENRR